MKTKVLLATLAAIGLAATSAVAQPTVNSVVTNGLFEPVSVAVDSLNNAYIADSANFRIIRVDGESSELSILSGITGVQGTNDGFAFEALYTNPQGVALATIFGTNGLLVADSGGHTIRFINLTNQAVITLAGTPGTLGSTANAAGAAATFNSPVGLSIDANNVLYIADAGNNAIRAIRLTDATFGVTNIVVGNTTFFQPNAVAAASTNQLWVADTRNHSVKLIDFTNGVGNMSALLGSNDRNLSGDDDNQFAPLVRFNNPRGLLWLGTTGGLLISDSGNHTLRLATNFLYSTNYSVSTFAGAAGQAGTTDGLVAAARFNGPRGIARDNLGGILVVDMLSSRLRRIQFFPTQPPVPRPRIGRIEEVIDIDTGIRSFRLFDIESQTFNNDFTLGIDGTPGTETYYTVGPSPASVFEDTIPVPSRFTGATPPEFDDPSLIAPSNLLTLLPRTTDMTVKARGFGTDRVSSEVDVARIIFRVGNPSILGNNAASFGISNVTESAEMWYTTDGTEPTNAPPSIGPITSGTTLSIPFTGTNETMVFQIRGFRANYLPSTVVSNQFNKTNFAANLMTFGFAGGEASSDFTAAPGQRFFAPVTLTLLDNQRIHSMQFAATATNGTGPALAAGVVHFDSTLKSLIPGTVPPRFATIPPMAFAGVQTNFTTNVFLGVTNVVTNIVNTFTNFATTNGTINLISVGWFELEGQQNLYNSLIQDLITFSQPHNTVFSSTQNKKVVVGAFSFVVPGAAPLGSTYTIQLLRPSATVGLDDDVFIETPTNGALVGSSPVNAIKTVTVAIRSYLVGDVEPFRWFNAGDFGETNLLNNDVFQVFQATAYLNNRPPAGTDFFDAMDSSNGNVPALYDGNDLTINAIALGDGVLGVDDVFVTFRRSLDPTLVNYQRSWSGGVLTAAVFPGSVGRSGQPNLPAEELTSNSQANAPAEELSSEEPAVSFSAGDVTGAAGDLVSVPITVQVRGSFPVRVLALNLTVKPVDGSPAIAEQITFVPNPALGNPDYSMSQGLNNYAAAWLDNTIAGLSGDALVGTLQVRIPAGATANSAYAIVFEHVSASSRGWDSFRRHQQVHTGVLTHSARAASTFGDSIPDAWRIRYFGSASNPLSAPGIDSDGDGVSNWLEYKAGTDPNDANSRLAFARSEHNNGGFNIRFPSALGRQYVVEASETLFGSDWVPVSGLLNGTGWEVQFRDTSAAAGLRFYRVRVVEE
ncbi:MAG: hypothetical protein AB1705_08190 [Verrucomicrobiota bacterium]